MRLFVALPVAEDARARIADAVGPWRSDDRLAWTRPEGWHLTVAFLGEVAAEALDEVAAAVRVGARDADTAGPVSLATGRTTTLGRGALALSVHADPDGVVEALGASIQAALVDAELPVTRRAVRPHVTLGRARRRRPVPRDLVDAVAVPPVAWSAEAVHVVESVLGSGPATYEVRATVGLPDR